MILEFSCEQAAHEAEERRAEAVRNAMAQIYGPSKDYAESSFEDQTRQRRHKLVEQTGGEGAWVAEFDRQAQLREKVRASIDHTDSDFSHRLCLWQII